MEKKSKRVDTFDIMKFFGIMMVIIGHMTHYFEHVIFSFHMPLFFIIAGYFYHSKGIKESFAKDVKHLIYPYVLTALAIVLTYLSCSVIIENVDIKYWLIAMVYGSGSVNHSSILLAKVPPIGAIWFLLALFWCKNIYNVVNHYTKKPMIVSFLLSVAAILLDKYLINLPLAILPGIGAVMFYALGFFLKQIGGFAKINPFIGIFLILIWIVSFLTSDMSMVRCYYQNFIINVIGAIGGTYVLFLISDVLSTCRYPLHKVVIWGGKNSLIFLCIHLYDLDVPIRGFLHIPNIVGIPLVILMCFVGTYVMSKIPFTKMVYNIKPFKNINYE